MAYLKVPSSLQRNKLVQHFVAKVVAEIRKRCRDKTSNLICGASYPA